MSWFNVPNAREIMWKGLCLLLHSKAEITLLLLQALLLVLPEQAQTVAVATNLKQAG